MKKWQKIWIAVVLIGSVYHLIRDILQFAGVEAIFTKVLSKEPPENASWIWHPLNTVIIESVLLILGIRVWLTKKFGWSGWGTVFIVTSTILAFAYYWFFLPR